MLATIEPTTDYDIGLLQTTERVLAAFVAEPGMCSRAYPWDSGPMVLASLAQGRPGYGGPPLEDVVAAWLSEIPTAGNGLALFGGAGAVCHGMDAATPHLPALVEHQGWLRAAYVEQASQQPWSRPARDWPDYDLVTGPAGGLLMLCAHDEVQAGDVEALARHLHELLRVPRMAALRLSDCEHDAERAWNFREVNLGLAHGVAGPIAALAAHVRRFGDDAIARTVSEAADWLVAQAHVDDRRMVTWALRPRPGGPWSGPTSTPQPASRREAWCHGAPALGWVLWMVGETLGRADLRAFASEVFLRWVRGFDEDFHLDDDPHDRLAVCHGAAGCLLLAEAFARRAGLVAARRLAVRLQVMLLTRLREIEAMAHANPSLLRGGIGVLAALLTVQGGDRRWLRALAIE